MMTPKTYTQQRAVLRPNRNVAFFDDDDFIEDDMQSNHDNTDIYSLTEDDGSSMHSILTNTDTLVLAQFLANTGPEEFMKPTKQQQQNPQFHRASRLFNKLRKKGGNVFSNLQQQQQQQQQQQTNGNNKRYTNSNSIRSMKSQQSNQEKKNYIPLPVYQPPLSSPQPTTTTKTNNQQHEPITIKPSVSTSSSTSTSYHRRQKRNLSISSSSSSHHIALRDSGIYSETSEKGDDLPPPLPSPPMIPSKSYYRLQQQQNQQPKRPAPLPPAVASAAIASATTNTSVDQYTSMDHSSILNQRRKSIGKHPIPSAALKRKSITRIRHIQVQTDNNNYSKDDGNNNGNKSNNSNVCQHCHQAFLHKNDNDEYNGKRRTSCPSILPTGQLLLTNSNNNNNNNQLDAKDAMQLLSMIEQLKLQLAEEQKSRLLLEQTIQRQLNGNKL